MKIPEDRRYSNDHEWAMTIDGGVRMGITDYAQDALGDVVYVELPYQGRIIEKGESIVEIESTKSIADVYAPIAGTIRVVNVALVDSPDLINQDPYGAGWFVEIEGESTAVDDLLDATDYRMITE